MKNRAFAAAVVLAAAPTLAYADNSAQFSVLVTATVPTHCGWVFGGDDVRVTLADFVDHNARVVGNTRTIGLGKMSCNGPATVSLKTDNGGLKNAETGANCGSSGNSSCVNYIASAIWTGATPTTVSYTTNGTAEAVAHSEISSGGGTGLVEVNITPEKPAGDVPLLEGDFTDTLTLQVGPPM